MWQPLAGELQPHLADHKAIARGLLENAIAIAELTVVRRELDQLPARHLHRGETVKAILQLDTIGPDILDWCGTDVAGNQGQVFQSAEPLSNAAHNQLVPVFSGSSRDSGCPLGCGHRLKGKSLQADVQRETGEVTGQHNITAATERQNGQMLLAGEFQCLAQTVEIRSLGKVFCAGRDGQRIKGLKVCIGPDHELSI